MPITIPGGLYWPFGRYLCGQGTSTSVLDAAGERLAFYGHLYLQGRASGVKTLDTSSLCRIQFRLSANTWATSGSVLRVGLQSVNAAAGPPMQPDGTWLVRRDITQGADSLVNSFANSFVPDSGTVSLSHGDEICFVFDMTGRAGADSLSLTVISGSTPGYGLTGVFKPMASTNVSGSWAGVSLPFIILTFSDGTVGFVDGYPSPASAASLSWSDATNPDERGTVFQVPFDTKVDALWAAWRTLDANSDGTLTLYSDPFGSPTVLATRSLVSEVGAATNSQGMGTLMLTSPISLSANTDYCVALRATGSSTLRNEHLVLQDAIFREQFPAGTTLQGVTRNNGSGAFGSASTTQFTSLGVRIYEVPSGGSGASGFSVSRLVT